MDQLNFKNVKENLDDSDQMASPQSERIFKKRDDYIDWDDYFIALACLASKRSKDPITQVGACVVNTHNRIVGLGYNGMPSGCNDDIFPWTKTSSNPLENKFLYVCHAEMNAILNKNCADIQGCKIYTALFPCNQCTKIIIQSGITEVVYMSKKNIHQIKSKASVRMLDAAGLVCRQYIPKFGGVSINFKKATCENLFSDSTEDGSMSSHVRQSSPTLRDITKKRMDYLEWEEYFMALTFLVSKRSKDPILQLGSCIVNRKNRIVSQGYNGMPFGCSDDIFPWGTDYIDKLDNSALYECHAELNAILNTSVDLKDCIMYSIVFPCNECAKVIIQSGISEIVYLYSSTKSPVSATAAQSMFDAAGVIWRQHHPKTEILTVDFSEINWGIASQLPPTPCKDLAHLALSS